MSGRMGWQYEPASLPTLRQDNDFFRSASGVVLPLVPEKGDIMSLSCSCDYDYDQDPGDWTYCLCRIDSYKFRPLETSRRVRCCSCKELIDIGSLVVRHRRHRYPYDDIESRIKIGRDIEDAFCDPPTIRMSNHYQCERCGEIWLNLQALGFECLSPGENMPDALAEYHDLTGWEKAS
jgi:hypothetical protein